MGEKEIAKTLLMGGEVIEVDRLPVGKSKILSIDALPPQFNNYENLVEN